MVCDGTPPAAAPVQQPSNGQIAVDATTADGHPYVAGSMANQKMLVAFTCASAPTPSVMIGGAFGDGKNQFISSGNRCTDSAGNAVAPISSGPINVDTGAQPAKINDTDAAIRYTGTGWGYYANRGVGDLSNDMHATTNDGDSASYTFSGTGISRGRARPLSRMAYYRDRSMARNTRKNPAVPIGSRMRISRRSLGRIGLRSAAVLASLGLRGALLPGSAFELVETAQAAVPLDWRYKAFSIAPYSAYELYNSGAALQELAATGANTVTFVPTWYTSSTSAGDIFSTGATATDAALVWAMQQARASGLQVMLKPHLDIQNGAWRAYIAPSNAGQWFANYAGLINHYADMATAQSASVLCIGAELITMTTNTAYTANWRSLISGVRQRFGGKLTYSANWGPGSFSEEFTRIPFWDALDYLGISAYFNLATSTSPTVSQLNASWLNWQRTRILQFQQRVGKPIFFTEVGYRSASGAAMQPWDSWDAFPFDGQLQADLYEALFESWATNPLFAGAAFWWWDTTTSVSSTGTGYEVQNKLAQSTVSAWFGAAPLPSFALSASVSPGTVSRGSAAAISVSVTSVHASSALIDIEVHDVSGGKVFQQFFDRQTFAAGAARTYSVNWQVPASISAGSYTVAVGVFAPGWAAEYEWKAQATQLTVSALPSFTISGSARPTSLARGQTDGISVSVTSATTMRGLVDIEVHNAANTTVFQNFVDNQAFIANQARAFAVSWPVPTSLPVGMYAVQVGIFSPGWTQLEAWNADVAQVTIR